MFALERLLRDMDITYRTWDNSSNTSMVVGDDNLIMEFEVPGFSKKDLNVKVENNVLSVSGCAGLGAPPGLLSKPGLNPSENVK